MGGGGEAVRERERSIILIFVIPPLALAPAPAPLASEKKAARRRMNIAEGIFLSDLTSSFSTQT